jgi:hypothetical protein
MTRQRCCAGVLGADMSNDKVNECKRMSVALEGASEDKVRRDTVHHHTSNKNAAALCMSAVDIAYGTLAGVSKFLNSKSLLINFGNWID